MAISASAVVVSSSSDVPMPKKRKVAPDMDDALRLAPQRIMKDMMPILMMMMSMMPVMMSQMTQMAARMPHTFPTSAEDDKEDDECA